MDPEQRWKRKKEIFAAAAELTKEKRDAFLQEQCADDADLRLEVGQLLDQLSVDDRTERLLPVEAQPQQSPESLRPGSVLASRFRIVRLLGRGGMGEVYEAEDATLGGRVALKTLRPELATDQLFLQRFMREVNLARQITHPNICRVFDVGFEGQLAFLTMELLRGQSLAERIRNGPQLGIAEVRKYACQILDALTAAHAKRITHRDLKPGNITITGNDGAIKIVDFGLAKSLQAPEPASQEETAAMAQETRAGVVLGTVGYMSPEQALGRPVDERSDLFSFGAVLYEMVTGRRPFGSGHQHEVIARLVTEQPEPASSLRPDVPDAMRQVIERCLEKDRTRRFASAGEALAVLREESGVVTAPSPAASLPATATAAAAPNRRWMLYAGLGGAGAIAASAIAWKTLADGEWDSLAVLPLRNEGPADNEFLTDGFTESLINDVSRGALRVIARSAVYRLKNQDPIEAAKKLGVSAVLTGSLVHRGAGQKMVLSLELTDVAKAAHLWGKRVELALSMLQSAQAQVANEVLAALKVQIRSGLALQVRPVDPAAYELYLKGRHFWNKRTLEAFDRAIESYQQAVDISPAYALAHAGLADVYAFQSGSKKPADVFPRALAEARKAIELDFKVAEAHASLAFSLLHFEWDWRGSEASCERALELNPNYPSAHSYYGRLLTTQKRFDAALEQVRIGRTLDPLSPGIVQSLAATLYLARRHDEASQQLEQLLNVEKSFTLGYFTLAVIRLAQGRTADALELMDTGLKMSPNDSGAIADWGMIHGMLGNRDKAAEATGRLEKMASQRYVAPYFLALPWIGLGDKAKALDWLEKAADDRSWQLPYIGAEPKMDSLRSEPRFGNLLQRLKLP
jgi:tetratricopeptide (TPR) repeat protein/tRNA A-37 threonylcarbamoyl transferase component Bud32